MNLGITEVQVGRPEQHPLARPGCDRGATGVGSSHDRGVDGARRPQLRAVRVMRETSGGHAKRTGANGENPSPAETLTVMPL